MDTREALLAAVIAAPDDDLPRLVYADHLEENGDDGRAKFIRASVELSRRTDGYSFGYGDPPGEPDSLERVLFDLAGKGVYASLQAIVDGPAYWTFARHSRVVRGFVHTVRCTLADWLKHGLAVAREHPVVKVVAVGAEPREYPAGRFTWDVRMPWEADSVSPWLLPAEVIQNPIIKLRVFSTAKSAIDALSTALIAWAKSQPV